MMCAGGKDENRQIGVVRLGREEISGRREGETLGADAVSDGRGPDVAYSKGVECEEENGGVGRESCGCTGWRGVGGG
jgi:hypothetical protein